VLVARRADHVELRELDTPCATLIESFQRGETLSAAANSLLHSEPNADLGRTLRTLMQLNLLADFQRVPI
jgi:hypothetical protein